MSGLSRQEQICGWYLILQCLYFIPFEELEKMYSFSIHAQTNPY